MPIVVDRVTLQTGERTAAKRNKSNLNFYAESRLELCTTFTVWVVVLQNETYQGQIEKKTEDGPLLGTMSHNLAIKTVL